MNVFGELLRGFRRRCSDVGDPVRKLTQEKLGRLLGTELGDHGFSGAAVSDWERGKSKIHADDRLVLTALIKVLHECGGLKTIEEANQFLEAGNYRVLDIMEMQKIFIETTNDVLEPSGPKKEDNPGSFLPFLLENLFSVSPKELQILIAKAADGPPPSWPRVLAAILRKGVERWSISTRHIIWVWLWFFAWWLTAPSLRWPFADRASAFSAICMYAVGTFTVPLLIGLLVNTSNNEYWKQQDGVDSFLLRLYTYQGAGVGFNLGYFFVFPFSLVRYYLHLESSIWMELAAVTLGLIVGNMSARVVPYNLWLAYGRLKLADGAIFFVVALLGPLWGWFFLQFYSVLLAPILGIVIILSAITIAVFTSVRKSKSK